MTAILDGILCDNTCFSFSPGDNSPDLGLFGPAFGDLTGKPFHLVLGDGFDSLTINGHTVSWMVGDPHYSITPNGDGSYEFVATIQNQWGLTSMFEQLCPAVPEPGTFVLMAIGLLAVVAWRGRGK